MKEWAEKVSAAYVRVLEGLTPDFREMLSDIKLYVNDRETAAYGVYDPTTRSITFFKRAIDSAQDPDTQLELTVRHEVDHALGWWHTDASHVEMSGAWISAWYGRGPVTVKLTDGTLVTLPGR